MESSRDRRLYFKEKILLIITLVPQGSAWRQTLACVLTLTSVLTLTTGVIQRLSASTSLGHTPAPAERLVKSRIV